MSQELQAGAVTLLQLLKGEKQFVSPLFQRRYVWTNKQITNLWEDIDGILEGSAGTRFLGAVVLEIREAGLAFKPDSMWIVDGQQRISTLYMTLLRVAIEAQDAGEAELANTIHKQYLFNQDGQYKDRPKLQPTLLDFRQFNNIFDDLNEFQPRLEPAYGDEHGQMLEAYGVLRKAVRDRCKDGKLFSKEKAKLLVSALLEKLKFVQIVLGEAQDPHQVFDSLNARGIRLENKDLIRNIVFEQLVGKAEEAQTLYNGRWLPFEQSLGDRLDSYFFPFGLIHKANVTKATLLGVLRERWKSMDPAQILDDLSTYVPCFSALTLDDHAARQAITDSVDIQELLGRFRRMRIPSTTFSYLLRLLLEYQRGSVVEEWVVRNLKQLESFLVRRALAGFEPSGLHAVFKNLWAETAGDPVKFIEVIDNNPTVHFPNDAQFARDIKEESLYGRRLAPYVLAEYERALRGGDPIPEGIEPTIDHVMPQELTAAWEGVVSVDDHKVLKHTWANLVPLSLPANAEKGQKPWSEVKLYFQTETIFKTTKRLAQQYEHWDASTIRERAESLSIWALNRWPKRA